MRVLWLHIVLLLLSGRCYAQGSGDTTRPVAPKDTLPSSRSTVVVIEARSIVPRVARGSQPLAIMNRAQIEASGAIDLADVVGFSPGVFVKQYGGAGGLRTVSLRGTSAQQTVILVDGVRYQSSASGAFDLGNIPAAAMERVEVIRGGSAALYGANALGGVINIVTGRRSTEALAISASGGAGSYGERRLGLDLDGASGSHSWEGGLNLMTSEGDYPFLFNEYGQNLTVKRENGDFSNLFARAGWRYQGDDLELSLRSQGFISERGTPGGVVQGNREQVHARLDERDLFAVAQAVFTPDDWRFTISGSGRTNTLRYRDPDARLIGPEGIDNRYGRNEISIVGRGRRLLGEEGIIEALGELSYESLEGDNLDPSAGASVYRITGSTAINGQWLVGQSALGRELTIDAGLRADIFSDLDPVISPALGLVWRPWEFPLRLRARGAMSYRAPAFSEQYYLNFGNTDLRPERSRSLDIGTTFELDESLALESSYFLIDTRDQIVAVPRSPVRWSAANIARVRTRGLEVSASGSLFDRTVGLRLSYTLMEATDLSDGEVEGGQLVYSPNELFNGLLDLHLDRYRLGLSWQYVSHRYTRPDEDVASALPHYALLGMSGSAGWDLMGIGVTLRMECTNILDARYQVIRNYPMPGRTFRVGLEIRYR